jgi:amino acid transporter
MLKLQYDCNQPIFYLGSALTSLSAITVYLAKLQKSGKISTFNMLLMLVIYAIIIYAISRLINWCCNKGYTNVAWIIALLPIIGVLATAFE